MADKGQRHYGNSSLVGSTGHPEPGWGTSSQTWLGRHWVAQRGVGHHQPREQPCCPCLDKGHTGHPTGTEVLVCSPGNAVFLLLMTHQRWIQFPQQKIKAQNYDFRARLIWADPTDSPPSRELCHFWGNHTSQGSDILVSTFFRKKADQDKIYLKVPGYFLKVWN